MTDKTTGGPAFPVFKEQYDYGIGEKAMHTEFGGMTLRDYFAAKAMQGFISGLQNKDIPAVKDSVGVLSYAIADAMLKARDE